MERLYRILLIGLFILGFLGAVASADKQNAKISDAKNLISMINDIRLAQEVNDINGNRWNQDVANINEDGLARVEQLLSQGETTFNPHSHQ